MKFNEVNTLDSPVTDNNRILDEDENNEKWGLDHPHPVLAPYLKVGARS